MACRARSLSKATSQDRLRVVVFWYQDCVLGAHLEASPRRCTFPLFIINSYDFYGTRLELTTISTQNHPNLGLCLDTAHFPFGPGYGWDVLAPKMWSEEDFQAMLGRLRAIPADRIFYVELSDVVPVTTALGKGSRFDEWRAKANSPRGDTFVWATCGRCLPEVGSDAGRGSEKGGARVAEALKAILDTGFNGMFLVFPSHIYS